MAYKGRERGYKWAGMAEILLYMRSTILIQLNEKLIRYSVISTAISPKIYYIKTLKHKLKENSKTFTNLKVRTKEMKEGKTENLNQTASIITC